MVELTVSLRNVITRLEDQVTQLAEEVDYILEFNINVSSLILNTFSILSDSASGLAGIVYLIISHPPSPHLLPLSSLVLLASFLPLPLSLFPFLLFLLILPFILPLPPLHTVILPAGPLLAFIWNFVLLAHMITQVQ